MRLILVLIGIVCFSLVLPGCSSIIAKTYKPANYAEDQIKLFGKPVVLSQIKIDRIRHDGSRKNSEVIINDYSDYRILGVSSFRSTAIGDGELQRYAASVGASLVVVFHGWAGTVQTGTLGNSVSLGGGTTIGVATPIRSDVSDYHATFLVKYAGKKESIGIVMAVLTSEVQQRLERNKGVLVSDVLRGPAFDANVLIGDVIIAVNGAQVIDYKSLGLLVRKSCRKKEVVVLSVLRGEQGEKRREISIPNCM